MLGAGIQGCCIALELARRGHRVDLYDRRSAPLTQASYWNEGKIHLGLVYANDPCSRTHQRMLDGAMRFERLLARWTGGARLCRSTAFYYAVHRTSLLDCDRIAAHFSNVAERYAVLRSAHGLDYFDSGDGPLYRTLSSRDAETLFDPAEVRVAYATAERAVNPRHVAGLLREAIAAEPRIEFRGLVDIECVTPSGASGIVVSGKTEGSALRETYRDVVNASWGGRLAIDRTFGVSCERPWFYRTKMGVILAGRADRSAVPSTTFVLGSYGDTVSYEDGSIYISWYPACLVGTSQAVVSPDHLAGIGEAGRRSVALRSLAAMSRLVPALAPYCDGSDIVEMGGGIIFAWGEADIDDPGSELHRRYDIGVHSYGRYHSVDTGKYTMAPYFAVDTCDRIEGAI